MVGFICKTSPVIAYDPGRSYEADHSKVRDQQTSAALGLPPRIRDEDCQIADLEPSDFEEGGLIGPSEIFRAPPDVHVSYVIGMSQLARLCMTSFASHILPFAEPPQSSTGRCLQPIFARSIEAG